MLIRDHPLMSRRGIPNWPPVWTWTDGLENAHAKGEVGILKAVTLSNIGSPYKCYLHIYYEGSVKELGISQSTPIFPSGW